MLCYDDCVEVFSVLRSVEVFSVLCCVVMIVLSILCVVLYCVEVDSVWQVCSWR